ncbi:MAG TPA: spermidine/putrescine ABC transporter substrate-binding protein [Streptosporangiaceae bacterium]|nr:spermidine/putrescine ABC transporter substrate-binding protein [Streptosporangiaceae bacterium]
MHPREGWRADGSPPPAGPSRRGFLRQGAGAGALLGAGGLSSLIAACGSAGPAGTAHSGLTANGIPLPRPNSPVTWPVFADNKAIKSGLQPEQNATLRIYNWVAYINEDVIKAFCKKYNCKYELSTFNNMDEAMAKLRSGQLDFDIFFPTIDVLGELVYGKLIQPVNHSYVPNISQAWSDFANPFYDGKWQYTVPYTIYTTGIAWRKDHVPEDPYTMANPWAMPWNGKYKGKVAILDDYRESVSLALMKNGIFDLNTLSPSQIKAAGDALANLAQITNVHIDNNDYTEVPGGQIWIHHAWSGDIATSAYYMQKGVPVDVVGYWFPTDGKGPVGNDLVVVLKNAPNPVLAHLFQNYLLDQHNALSNYSYTGYMQPINGITPELLVSEQLLPKSLMSTTVLPSYFRRGVMELQLPVTANGLWEQAWLQAKSA